SWRRARAGRRERRRRPVARRELGADAPDFTSTREAKLAARLGKLAATPAMPESEETRTLHPRQESETPLLAVVKTLVKRRQSVAIALERGAAGGERISIALSVLDWVFRRLFGA